MMSLSVLPTPVIASAEGRLPLRYRPHQAHTKRLAGNLTDAGAFELTP